MIESKTFNNFLSPIIIKTRPSKLWESSLGNIHIQKIFTLRNIHPWKVFTPEKYSPLKNIHPLKIFTLKIFTLYKYSPLEIFYPKKYSPWKRKRKRKRRKRRRKKKRRKQKKARVRYGPTIINFLIKIAIVSKSCSILHRPFFVTHKSSFVVQIEQVYNKI